MLPPLSALMSPPAGLQQVQQRLQQIEQRLGIEPNVPNGGPTGTPTASLAPNTTDANGTPNTQPAEPLSFEAFLKARKLYTPTNPSNTENEADAPDVLGLSVQAFPNQLPAQLPSLRGGNHPSKAEALRPLIQQAALRNGLQPSLVEAVIRAESAYNPQARSAVGAQGLMQLMPATAKSLGVNNPLDPAQNIEGGSHYLAQLLQRFEGNKTLALAAYNAGPNAVQRHGGVPPYKETQQYVKRVLNYEAQLQQGGQ